MAECWRPIRQEHTRCEWVILDTEDRYDAWNTGRDGPESALEGDGLKIVFDGTGTMPCVAIYGPDGSIELRGIREIRAVWAAMRSGLRYAEAFGPPIPDHLWRQLNG